MSDTDYSSDRTMRDEALVGLVESIPKSKSLTRLYINNISQRGYLNILLAIRQSPNLEKFSFN